MAINEREHHIKVLEKMFYSMEKLENGVILPTSEVKTALAYAISSLKTDEAYQLMYEGEEIYTKADIVVMLTEVLDNVEEVRTAPSVLNDETADAICAGIAEILRAKIDKLKEAGE